MSLFSNSLYLESLNNSNDEIDLSQMGNFSGLMRIEGAGNTQALFSGREIEADFLKFPKARTSIFQ